MARHRQLVVLAIALGIPASACLLRQDLGSNAHADKTPTDTTDSTPDGTKGDPASDAVVNPDGVDPSDAGPDATLPLSPQAREAFDPASCPGAPIGFAGLASIVKQPIPYRIFGRVRDCVNDTCTAWAALPDTTVVDYKLGGVFRAAARTGKLVAGAFNSFNLVSDETCPGGSADPYGAENCEIQDSIKSVCGFYYAPQLGDAGDVCNRTVSIATFIGSSSPKCIQMASSYLDPSGRQYQFAVLVRF